MDLKDLQKSTEIEPELQYEEIISKLTSEKNTLVEENKLMKEEINVMLEGIRRTEKAIASTFDEIDRVNKEWVLSPENQMNAIEYINMLSSKILILHKGFSSVLDGIGSALDKFKTLLSVELMLIGEEKNNKEL